MTILEEKFKWHLEAFASELFIYIIKSLTSFISHCSCLYSKSQMSVENQKQLSVQAFVF